jgi:hypothetical protein
MERGPDGMAREAEIGVHNPTRSAIGYGWEVLKMANNWTRTSADGRGKVLFVLFFDKRSTFRRVYHQRIQKCLVARIIFGFFFSNPSCFLFEKEEDLDTFYFPPIQTHFLPTWPTLIWKY